MRGTLLPRTRISKDFFIFISYIFEDVFCQKNRNRSYNFGRISSVCINILSVYQYLSSHETHAIVTVLVATTQIHIGRSLAHTSFGRHQDPNKIHKVHKGCCHSSVSSAQHWPTHKNALSAVRFNGQTECKRYTLAFCSRNENYCQTLGARPTWRQLYVQDNLYLDFRTNSVKS